MFLYLTSMNMLVTLLYTIRDTGAIFWESMERTVREYIRSCALLDRKDRHRYYGCRDHIHNGYVALDRGMQFMINSVCNRYLFNNSQHAFANNWL